MDQGSQADGRPRRDGRVRAWRRAGLVVGVLVTGVMFRGSVGCLDFDRDSYPDTVVLGGTRLHLFSTPRMPEGQEAARPIGGNFEDVLRQALATNDFVMEFLHRSNSSEVETVRRFAEDLVGDVPTDRLKVERLVQWLAANWDFTVELSTVNAADLLARRQGMCETSGFVVGVLDVLGIKAREVTNTPGGIGPGIAVEAWLDGGWRVVHLFAKPPRVDDRSMLELFPGHATSVSIVYYWKDPADPKRRLLRTKLWYEPRLGPIFRTNRGLERRQMPDSVADLRISY